MASDRGWHREVRLALFEKYKSLGYEVFTSHSDVSHLNLFKYEVKRECCLSDADIVVFDKGSKRIKEIIEVETGLNPKKVIGIVLATHLTNICRIKRNDYQFSDVVLRIVYRRPQYRSRKALKLEVIEKPLKEILNNQKGSIADFKFEEHE